MKLEPIKNYNLYGKKLPYNNIENAVTEPSNDNIPESKQQKVFAQHLNFKGTIPSSNLLADYKWFIKHDKIPAIDAYLKIDAPKNAMNGLLKEILEDQETSYDFIDSIIVHPRRTKEVARKLKEKLPEPTKLLDMYAFDSPYRIAYQNYIDARYRNASSVSELLKIRPDWQEEVLLRKHRELYNNNNFELGFVPESIGEENFSAIVKHLQGYTDYGFKTLKTINDLNINNKTFKFKNYIDGRSDKNVFLVQAPNDKQYILKMGTIEQRGLNKPFAIGTCSIIDSYLTQNNCRNSAPLRYYNHDNNVAIYDYIEHQKTDKMQQLHDFVINMPDFADLGLRHSDTVGNNNYFILDKTQNAMKTTYDFDYGVKHNELISVDNDHVTYVQGLNPMLYQYHTFLPEAMQMFF